MDENTLAAMIGGDATAAPAGQESVSVGALEIAPPAAPAASEGPARGPDGRFAPREGQATPVAAPTAQDAPAQPAPAAAAPPAPAAAEPGHVPLSAVLDERERRQAAEARLAEYEERQRAQRAQASQADLPPDVRMQQALYAQNLRTSRRFAERAYGAETMATVHDWASARCDADPIFNQQMASSEDPYESAYQAWQREQLLAEVSPNDLDDYRAWKAARAAGQTPPAQPAAAPAAHQAPPSPPPPPRSLANAPNAGGGQTEIAVGPGAAFNATIGNRR